jgi:(2Fe-2S) ferredoxin
MPVFDKHIFVCNNQREADHPRGSCNCSGSGALHKALKRKLAQKHPEGVFRVNQAGCLNQCEHGPVIVVYPEAVWYGGVTEADLDEIIESHIVGGRPVERLRIPGSCLNNPHCPHMGKKA